MVEFHRLIWVRGSWSATESVRYLLRGHRVRLLGAERCHDPTSRAAKRALFPVVGDPVSADSIGLAAPFLARFCDICLLHLYCLRLDYASKPGACQWACGFFF